MAVRTAQSQEAGRAPLPLTGRQDTWWIKPLITVIVLGFFALYGLVRAIENQYFEFGPYIAPFYSPHLPIEWNLFGWNVSPAIYILIFPLSFRLTCYYYRLAYYRAFFWDPPACAVREPYPRKHYTGERGFPFILQNIHRYAFYGAVVILAILTYDAIKSFFWSDGFHVGLGTVILVVNVVILALYTFSCHSFRHLIGGRVNCYSCSALSMTRYGIWKRVSFLNERHALYAWISLFSVLIADLYIRFVAMYWEQQHILIDIRFF